jgi:hypothetical protein
MLTSLDSTYNATFEFNDDKPKEYSDSFTLDLEKGSYTFTITVEPIVKRDTQVIIAFMVMQSG